MEPTFLVAFDLGGQEHEVRVRADGMAWPAGAVADLGVSLARDRAHGVWRVLAKPACELRVTRVRAVLPCDVGSCDALYHNGYQTWTDSVERSPRAVMPGLLQVPRALVEHYALDGSGDYRFARYSLRPGEQHGFGYCYLRKGERVTLVGSLTEDEGLTTIYSSVARGVLVLEKEPPARTLAAGETVELMAYAELSGSLDACVEEWLALSGVKARACAPIIGYSSWYRHYAEISEAKLLADLEGLATDLKDVYTGSADAVFQIDDGYAKVGDWLSYDAGRFPQGMAPLADAARARGMLPGIWLAPFMCERDSMLAAEHPSWLLRDADGSVPSAGCNWSGALPLDTRNPEVRAYVTHVLQTVTREWGFDLLKLDFLYAACMLPHDGLNRGQLMADALDLVREAVGEEVRLLLCGVPMTSAFGRADYCSIGCDVCLSWDDAPHMRLLHRERVSTKRSLANTRGRAHLNGRAFRNDPDVFFLRDGDVSLSASQREELLTADADLGGVFLTSDDMGSWTEGQRVRYREALDVFLAHNA